MSLLIAPCDLAHANAYIAQLHRHHGPVTGYKFALTAIDRAGNVHGVAIVGRPVNRNLDDGWTLEVNRLATDGTLNACSFLYSAAWKATKALGYRRLLTYILASEPGTSLRALTEQGWRQAAETNGHSWSCPSRPRNDKHPVVDKRRWQVESQESTPDVLWPEEASTQLVLMDVPSR